MSQAGTAGASAVSAASIGTAPPALCTVTVTFNPDLDVLARQLRQLPTQTLKIVVDNASQAELRQQLRALLAGRDDVRLLENEANIGLAAALNQGVRHACMATPKCRYVLLLDQDTEPGEGGVERLLQAFRQVAAEDPRTGAVGPRLVDVDTGLEHGFHQSVGWRIVRRHPLADAQVPIEVMSINGSGTLMPIEVFEQLGGLDEALFIDHLDTEWSFRLLAAGYRLYGIPQIGFRHRMGAAGIRYWLFGWRVWPYRSPLRHYYLFRNAMRLLRMPHVATVWKCWAPLKLLLTLLVHFGFDPARKAQVRQMLRGIREGLR